MSDDNTKLPESTKFDSLIGKKVKKQNSTTFFDIIEFDEDEKKAISSDDNEWQKYWKGMPEFDQDDKPSYKTIYVHFRNEEDYVEFSKLISQHLTPKTKSIWFPKLERTKNCSFRWIEDDEESD